MLKWEIDGKVRWLCPECTRENAHVFLLGDARFLAEEQDSPHPCYSCRCREQTASRFRKWRWLYYGFCRLLRLPSPGRAAVLRRRRAR